MQIDETMFDDRFCPVLQKEISFDLCFECILCLWGMFKPSSVPELNEVSDIEAARKICHECPHSDID